jgi:hypothetical protein
MKFRSFGDDTSSRIQTKLPTISLSSWKIKRKRVAEVNFKMNERSGNGTSSRMVNRLTNTS